MQVLITGASSGIGKALAIAFAAQKHDLIIVARREALLNTLAQNLRQQHQIKVIVEVLDLTKSRSWEQLVERYAKATDLLVNNAGFGKNGAFFAQSGAEINAMMLLNMHALTVLTHRFGAEMKQKARGGIIINIASVLANVKNTPFMSLYGASKHYVRALSQSINAEQTNQKVRIYTVCPGLIATEFAKRANLKEQSYRYATSPERIANKIVNKMLRSSKDTHSYGRGTILIKFLKVLPRRVINYFWNKSQTPK